MTPAGEPTTAAERLYRGRLALSILRHRWPITRADASLVWAALRGADLETLAELDPPAGGGR